MAQTLTIRNDRLGSAAEAGLKALESGSWTQAGENEFLALLALRVVICGYLVGEVRRVDNDGRVEIQVKLDGRRVPEDRKRAAQLLIAPLGVYADLAGISLELRANDVGAVPIPLLIGAGVVSVSIIAGGVYVATYVAKEASQIVDGALRRNAASQEVQNADAQALRVMNTHVQREIAAGKVLEFDAVERSVLNALQDRVSNIVKQAFEPVSSANLPPWVVPVVGIVGAAAVVSAFLLLRRKSS